MFDMDVPDWIDKISLEASKCTHREELPMQDTFLLSALIVSLEDKPVTYKIQWLHTLPFGHFMRIVHVTVAPYTGAPLVKQTEETQITIKNYRLASTLS